MRFRKLLCVCALLLGTLPCIALNAREARQPSVTVEHGVTFVESNKLTFAGTPAQIKVFELAQRRDEVLAAFCRDNNLTYQSTADKAVKRTDEGRLPMLTLTNAEGVVLYKATGKDALKPSSKLFGRFGVASERKHRLSCHQVESQVDDEAAPAEEAGIPWAAVAIVGLPLAALCVVRNFRKHS